MSVALRGTPYQLQAAGTTATGNGTPATVNPVSAYHTVFLKGTGTISSGTISIEEADTEDYAGTWSVITTVAGTALSGGAMVATHIEALLGAVRARVSVVIGGGGSIEATYKGN